METGLPVFSNYQILAFDRGCWLWCSCPRQMWKVKHFSLEHRPIWLARLFWKCSIHLDFTYSVRLKASLPLSLPKWKVYNSIISDLHKQQFRFCKEGAASSSVGLRKEQLEIIVNVVTSRALALKRDSRILILYWPRLINWWARLWIGFSGKHRLNKNKLRVLFWSSVSRKGSRSKTEVFSLPNYQDLSVPRIATDNGIQRQSSNIDGEDK